jgi:UDP-glucuronate 4-epimerase
MNVVVTGAAGFIGSHLVERLATDGHLVRAIDCLTPYYDVGRKRANLNVLAELPRCTVSEVDLRTDDLTRLLVDVDVVFHQAGQPGVRSSWDTFASYVEHNVLATQRLLEAVRGSEIRRFVFASSSSVYGDALSYPTSEDDLPAPASPYGVTKLAAEHLCGVYATNWNVPAVSLRYFTVFGPRQRPDMAMHRLIESALTGRPFPVYGDGQQVRDFTYISDVVEANVMAGASTVAPGTVLNIAGGAAATLLDVIGIVEGLTARTVPLDHRPVEPGDVRRTGGSIERASRSLGWRPTVSLSEGLARQVAWQSASPRER